MKIVLLGDEGSERTLFFKKAAKELGKEVRFIQFDAMSKLTPEAIELLSHGDCAVKIDPPWVSAGIESTYVYKIDYHNKAYKQILHELDTFDNLNFLNTGHSIASVLDKVRCKNQLISANIATTPLICGDYKNYEELKYSLKSISKHSVFIKPCNGAGAGGVMAYRINPGTGASILFTSAKLINGRLCNTRRLQKLTNEIEIEAYINKLLCLDVIIEGWIPKSKYNGKFYDLRVVFQFGRIAFIVARQSKGPITNLHLNNDAISVEELNLPIGKLEEIEELCKSAISLFPGLNCVGIDVLLTPDSLKPYIIEINGQGDLIYRDIFGENRIYREQIEYLQKIDNTT